jgi:DNA-binding NarL/FixJ family response regulator
MSSAARIRVLVADNHPLLRDGIMLYLGQQPDMSVVGEANNGAEAVEAYDTYQPDVMLLDLQMPVLGGIDVLTKIKARSPDARIVVLTTSDGDAPAMRALKAGACGYLLKNNLRRDLADTIRKVHSGRHHVQAEIAMAVAIGSLSDALSEREKQVLLMVADGFSNREIGERLGLTELTVKTHMRSISAKLGARDRTHAVTLALRRGIIEI